MTTKPQLNIGLPVFNGENYVRQALESLLAQEFIDFELIISDNGSSDKTREICLQYAAKDQRVKYYRYDINQGAIWNFNNVYQLSTAEYFMWAAHDDFWEPSYLRVCLEALKSSDTVVLAGTTCDCLNAQNTEIMLIDPGVNTVGLKPAARFKRYKQALHTGRNVNALFYGIYRRDMLAMVMPWEHAMSADNILLAKLSLLGEFFTSEKRLMKKRWGGGSESLEKAAQAVGFTNPLVIHSAYLIRELFLQKTIFTSVRLTFLEKIKISVWSWGNYLFLFLRLRYRAVRDFIKSMVKFRGTNHQ